MRNALYGAIPYATTLYPYAILHHTTLYYTILHYTAPCYTILHHTTLYYHKLHYTPLLHLRELSEAVVREAGVRHE